MSLCLRSIALSAPVCFVFCATGWFRFFWVPLKSLPIRNTFIPNANGSFFIGPALEMRSAKPSRFWSCFGSLPTMTCGMIPVIWEMYLYTAEGVNYSRYPAAIGGMHFPPACEAPNLKELTWLYVELRPGWLEAGKWNRWKGKGMFFNGQNLIYYSSLILSWSIISWSMNDFITNDFMINDFMINDFMLNYFITNEFMINDFMINNVMINEWFHYQWVHDQWIHDQQFHDQWFHDQRFHDQLLLYILFKKPLIMK